MPGPKPVGNIRFHIISEGYIEFVFSTQISLGFLWIKFFISVLYLISLLRFYCRKNAVVILETRFYESSVLYVTSTPKFYLRFRCGFHILCLLSAIRHYSFTMWHRTCNIRVSRCVFEVIPSKILPSLSMSFSHSMFVVRYSTLQFHNVTSNLQH